MRRISRYLRNLCAWQKSGWYQSLSVRLIQKSCFCVYPICFRFLECITSVTWYDHCVFCNRRFHLACLLACLLACSLNSVKRRGGASGRTSAPARSSPGGCVQGLAFLRRTCRSTPWCCPPFFSFCLPLRRFPSMVPCRITLARPSDP